MRHVILTCVNHPLLRWSTKEIAVSSNGKYNGARQIFFNGTPTGKGMFADGSGLDCTQHKPITDAEGKVTGYEWFSECSCPATDLCVAPEDAEVKRDE